MFTYERNTINKAISALQCLNYTHLQSANNYNSVYCTSTSIHRR